MLLGDLLEFFWRDLVAPALLLHLLDDLWRDLVALAGLLGDLAPAVFRPFGEFLRNRTTEDVPQGVLVGIERREVHEQDKDQGAGKGEGQVMAEKSMTQVADGTRLIRMSGG
jgi:hypothetical protein